MNEFNKEEDPIDVLALLKKVFRGRKIIIKAVSLFFIIGIINSLITPVAYKSETTFIPQVSDDQDAYSEGLSSLESIAGISLSKSTNTSSYLSPLLYSKIINSEEFSIDLINEEIKKEDGERISIKNYINNSDNNFNIIGFIKKYTIGLINKENNESLNDKFKDEFNFISNKDFSTINKFKKKFNIELHKEEGCISVIATDKNAFVSSQLVKIITKKLQSKIIKLRTDKINEQLVYSKKEYEKKQIEFDILQRTLAEFKDSNKNISSSKFLAELQKLESEFLLQENIRRNLAISYNDNKIKLNKDTPIFSVLDDVTVPNNRFKPKRMNIVIIHVILGLILSIAFILFKEPIKEILKEIKK